MGGGGGSGPVHFTVGTFWWFDLRGLPLDVLFVEDC